VEANPKSLYRLFITAFSVMVSAEEAETIYEMEIIHSLSSVWKILALSAEGQASE